MKVSIKNLETGTSPCIIHGNGSGKIPRHPWFGPWLDVVDCHQKCDTFQKQQLRNDLTIISWKGGKYANQTTPLEVSCEKFGVPIVMMHWYPVINFWIETKQCMIDTANLLRSIKTKYVTILDSGDVYLFKHPNDILDEYLEKFGEFSTVWNTETNDWPYEGLPKYQNHPKLDGPLKEVSKFDNEQKKIHGSRFAYLNGGVSIGRTEAMLEFYDYANKEFVDVATVNQAMQRITRHRFRNIHAMDVKCSMFQTLFQVSRAQLEVKLIS